jgi:hypothetical protein
LKRSGREELRLASLSSREPRSGPLTDVLPVVLLLHCDAIGKLATVLCARREITHADVCTALGLTDGGGPGSFELALVRSGSALALWPCGTMPNKGSANGLRSVADQREEQLVFNDMRPSASCELSTSDRSLVCVNAKQPNDAR